MMCHGVSGRTPVRTTRNQRQCQRHELRFLTRAHAGGGLGSLVVRCDTCRAERSLAGITAPASLGQLNLSCRGIQPWQAPRPDLFHPEVPEVVQRGASNVYFAHLRSAIDIPPESRFDPEEERAYAIRATPDFEVIVGAPDGPVAEPLIEALARSHGVEKAYVVALVQAELRRREGAPAAAGAGDIEDGEWAAFQAPEDETDDRHRFVTKHVSLSEARGDSRGTLLEPVDQVVEAVRLHVVRALTGFSRLSPGGPVVPPDLGRGLDWLPALEVYGEGIFLSFREEAVAAWEGGPASDRVAHLVSRREESLQREWLPEVNAKFVFLHTFAHLLIRQLAFDSGYASASLSERIYARLPRDDAPGMAGVLIYTAAGDQEGTLGGLVRQGEPDRLMGTLLTMLTRAMWCSSDPICSESTGQGVAALNLAACHACALIAETSCSYSNALLDRSLVIGGPERGVAFYEQPFASVLERAAAETTQ